jgi:L-ascorbate metabolism protein UlaG (beta-lactamase superfamily)
LLGCSQPQELLANVPGPGRFLTGEMSPREAALAAEMLKVNLAVACHYYDPAHEDVTAFLSLVPELDTTGARQAVAPKVGETLVVQCPGGDPAALRYERIRSSERG